jgi:hypothetical protein
VPDDLQGAAAVAAMKVGVVSCGASSVAYPTRILGRPAFISMSPHPQAASDNTPPKKQAFSTFARIGDDRLGKKVIAMRP